MLLRNLSAVRSAPYGIALKQTYYLKAGLHPGDFVIAEWKQDRFIKAYAAKKKFEAIIPTVFKLATIARPNATTNTKM